MGMRNYVIDGKKMTFNPCAFKTVFERHCRSLKTTFSKFEARLSEQLNISTDTIHGWRYGKNAPSGIEYVKELATVLELKDYTLLLTENDGGHDMNQLADWQLDAVKRIYDSCIWFLDEFNHSDGFNDYWLTFKQKGAKNTEVAICDYAEEMMRKINLVLSQEYFDLCHCNIYDELCEYVGEDLVDIYDGKVSYAYRFEASVNGNPSTEEDYDKAMVKLLGIIEKYVR